MIASIFDTKTYVHDFTKSSDNLVTQYTNKNSITSSRARLGFLDRSKVLLTVTWYQASYSYYITLRIHASKVFDGYLAGSASQTFRKTSTRYYADWYSVAPIRGSDFYAVSAHKNLIIAEYTSSSNPYNKKYTFSYSSTFDGIIAAEYLFDSGQILGIRNKTDHSSRVSYNIFSLITLEFPYNSGNKNPACGPFETPRYSFSSVGCRSCAQGADMYKGECTFNVFSTDFPYHSTSVNEDLTPNIEGEDFDWRSGNKSGTDLGGIIGVILMVLVLTLVALCCCCVLCWCCMAIKDGSKKKRTSAGYSSHGYNRARAHNNNLGISSQRPSQPPPSSLNGGSRHRHVNPMPMPAPGFAYSNINNNQARIRN